MQETSSTYRRLLSDDNHWYEARLVIGEGGNLITELGDRILFGGTSIVVARTGPDSGYPENYIFSIETNSALMEKNLEIGKCISQEISVKMLNPTADMPRMSVVIPYVRICTADEQSEWLSQGVFYIDTREITHNDDDLDILVFHGYDAMLKANQPYSESNLNWPADDTDVVQEIADMIGVSVDERTWDIMTDANPIPYPGSFTLIETLGFIASMYLGSFIMTETGELRLVSLTEMPRDSRYLIDHVGDAITFGGDRILV